MFIVCLHFGLYRCTLLASLPCLTACSVHAGIGCEQIGCQDAGRSVDSLHICYTLIFTFHIRIIFIFLFTFVHTYLVYMPFIYCMHIYIYIYKPSNVQGNVSGQLKINFAYSCLNTLFCIGALAIHLGWQHAQCMLELGVISEAVLHAGRSADRCQSGVYL